MTRNEARKIIKTYTQTKYSNSVLLLLLKLVDLTYRPDKDDVAREIKTSTNSLLRAAGVRHRQFVNILNQLKADDILREVTHTSRHVSCCLNINLLTELEPYGEKQKQDKKAHEADRAAKAREVRAEHRVLSRTIKAIGDAANADLREYVEKEALLQDAKDLRLKRHMINNWSVERIRRAKANSEAAVAEFMAENPSGAGFQPAPPATLV